MAADGAPIASAVLLENSPALVAHARGSGGTHNAYLAALYGALRGGARPGAHIAAWFFTTAGAPPVRATHALPDVLIDPGAPPVSVGALLYTALTLAEAPGPERHLFVVARAPPSDDARVHPAASPALVPRLQALGALAPAARWGALRDALVEANTRLHLLIKPASATPAIVDLFHDMRAHHGDVEVPLWFPVDHAQYALYLSGPPGMHAPPAPALGPAAPIPPITAHTAPAHPHPPPLPPPPMQAPPASAPPMLPGAAHAHLGPAYRAARPRQGSLSMLPPSSYPSPTLQSPPTPPRASPPSGGAGIVSYLRTQHGLAGRPKRGGAAPAGGVGKKPRVVRSASMQSLRSADTGVGADEALGAHAVVVESPPPPLVAPAPALPAVAAAAAAAVSPEDDPGNRPFIFPPGESAQMQPIPSFAPPGNTPPGFGYAHTPQQQAMMVSPTTTHFPFAASPPMQPPHAAMSASPERPYAAVPQQSPPLGAPMSASPEVHYAPPPGPPNTELYAAPPAPGPPATDLYAPAPAPETSYFTQPPAAYSPPAFAAPQPTHDTALAHGAPENYPGPQPPAAAAETEEVVPASSASPGDGPGAVLQPGQGFGTELFSRALANAGGRAPGLAEAAAAADEAEAASAGAADAGVYGASPPGGAVTAYAAQNGAAVYGGAYAEPAAAAPTNGFAAPPPPPVAPYANAYAGAGYATPPNGYATPPNGYAMQAHPAYLPLPAAGESYTLAPAPGGGAPQFAYDAGGAYAPDAGYAHAPLHHAGAGFAGMRAHGHAHAAYEQDAHAHGHGHAPGPAYAHAAYPPAHAAPPAPAWFGASY